MFIVKLCVLGNLCPETVEEAIAMVPSIKVVNHFGWTHVRLLFQFVKYGVMMHAYVQLPGK